MSEKDRIEPQLPKCPTGIKGLDEITNGGLPKGRPTLLSGNAGSGKTLIAMEFIVKGALEYDEPGVFMSFEESDRELAQNVTSLGWDLEKLVKEKKIQLSHVKVDRSEIVEMGDFELEGLFARLEHAIDSIGARRVVLDTIEVLFGAFTNRAILRSELQRLFRWLKEKGVTAIVTVEAGENTLTRHGIEEYVSDCVIFLDNRIVNQSAIRRLCVVKYRGTSHGTNEYPFLIAEDGVSLLPVTSLGLDYKVPTEQISTGIDRLDTMMGGEGYFRASSTLVSGQSGTGKTSVAAFFVDAACRRGERSLVFCFEESTEQLLRNMRSIGLDLTPWIKNGSLKIQTLRPWSCGLEQHLVNMIKIIEDFKPRCVAIDPISSFLSLGTDLQIKSMLCSLIDYLKMNQITGLFTDLSSRDEVDLATTSSVSSLIDTWIMLINIENQGERNRGLYIVKSRGMAHSNQLREFLLTNHGVDLIDVYVGPEGVLAGATRLTQEARQKEAEMVHRQEYEQKQRLLEIKRKAVERQIKSMREEIEAEEEELKKRIEIEMLRESALTNDQVAMGKMRGIDKPVSGNKETPARESE